MAYKTPAALEMAVKAAAKASLLDTGRAVSGFYFHRLLSLGSEGWLPDLAWARMRAVPANRTPLPHLNSVLHGLYAGFTYGC